MFQFLFCYILERKDKKSFKRDIIVLISFLILFVSISFLVNIGKEMSLPGFRREENFRHFPLQGNQGIKDRVRQNRSNNYTLISFGFLLNSSKTTCDRIISTFSRRENTYRPKIFQQ